jgi:hypothetical protein
MALTQPPLAITKLGTAVTPQTPAATENITAGGPLILWISCSSGAGTVTLKDPGLTPAGGAGADTVISVGAGVTKMIYLPTALTNPANNQVQVLFGVGTFTGQLYFVPSDT